MPRRSPRLACPSAGVVGLAALLVVGCADDAPTAPEYLTRVVPGALAARDALVVPDTAIVGVPFAVRVVTQGSACRRPAGTTVAMRGLVATVQPYDEVSYGPCTLQLVTMPRDVSLYFSEVGQAVVRAEGADGRRVERPVLVVPGGVRTMMRGR